MDAILELRQVSKHFAAHRAVREISLSVERGSFFSLLGPSGCGKTTTLRLIAGFETLTGGEIRLNGERIDHLPPYRRNVNTVFQNYALFPHLTVQGNVEFGLRRRARQAVHGCRGACSRRCSSKCGSPGRKPASPASFREASGNASLWRARWCWRRMSCCSTSLCRRSIRSCVNRCAPSCKDLQRSSGVTFLFVTHDQEEALSLSDRSAS